MRIPKGQTRSAHWSRNWASGWPLVFCNWRPSANDECKEQLIRTARGYAAMTVEAWDREEEDGVIAYDVRRVRDNDGDLLGVHVMLGGGGPTFWLDSHMREVRGYWAGDEVRAEIWHRDVCDWMNERFGS